MTFPDEPRGWRRLQALAQQAPDAQSLARIVDAMNRMLDLHERMASSAFPEMETSSMAKD